MTGFGRFPAVLVMAGILMFSFPALAADETQVRELPGNARIVVNPSDDKAPGYMEDDSSVFYRTMTRPYRHGTVEPDFQRNSVSRHDYTDVCGQTDSPRERNRCIGDLIKEREKIYKRYND